MLKMSCRFCEELVGVTMETLKMLGPGKLLRSSSGRLSTSAGKGASYCALKLRMVNLKIWTSHKTVQ